MIEEADGLIRIFNALLMIARAESQTSRENFSDLDAAELARDMAELYEPAAEEARASLCGSRRDRPAPIRGQRELIGQALANLIDNALKYGAPELPGESAEVAVTVALVDDKGRNRGRRSRAGHSRAGARNGCWSASCGWRPRARRPGSGLGLSLAAAVARLA